MSSSTVHSTTLGTQAKAVVAAFEQGRKDSRYGSRRRARYRDPERDLAYLRGWQYERERKGKR